MLSTKNIKKLRDQHIGPSFSLSYHEPLHIVKGKGQYLYASDGKQYLDAVNNISHVGHCHPTIHESLVKQNLKLNYILNTHHHYDHIGGNSELKKKYKAKVVGFKEDYKRIPEIDTKLKDEEIWKEDNFEAKVIHIPGHTLGHILDL